MNDLKKLERIQRFFMNLRRRWPLVLICAVAELGGIVLLRSTSGSKWSPVALCAVLAAAVYILLWCASHFVIDIVKKRRIEIYTYGVPNATKAEEKIHASSSRLLSWGERITAHRRFKELRDTSDYCFLGGPPSFVRIQWLEDSLRTAYEAKEVIHPWPNSNAIPLFFSYMEEEIQLTVVRECTENGERAFACLTPRNPSREEQLAAKKVELTREEPCLLAYGMIEEKADGTQVPYDVQLCAITWIGGNH